MIIYSFIKAKTIEALGKYKAGAVLKDNNTYSHFLWKLGFTDAISVEGPWYRVLLWAPTCRKEFIQSGNLVEAMVPKAIGTCSLPQSLLELLARPPQAPLPGSPRGDRLCKQRCPVSVMVLCSKAAEMAKLPDLNEPCWLIQCVSQWKTAWTENSRGRPYTSSLYRLDHPWQSRTPLKQWGWRLSACLWLDSLPTWCHVEWAKDI